MDPRGEPRTRHSGRRRTRLPEDRPPRSHTIIGPRDHGSRRTRHRRMNHEAWGDIEGEGLGPGSGRGRLRSSGQGCAVPNGGVEGHPAPM